MEITDRLKFVRKKLGLTQKEFGFPLDLSRDAITSLESGKVNLSTLHALAFENYYKINSKWLITGDGEIFINTISNGEVVHYQSQIEAEHVGLIKQFKNKDRAKLITESLLEIENIDESLFSNVEAYLSGVLSSAKSLINSDHNILKKKSVKGGDVKRSINGK